MSTATVDNEILEVNAQGVMSKPDFTNPIAIKMDSAKKMSIADKTGNEALKREAAAEQSFADRMGGRSALSKKKTAIPDQAQDQSVSRPESPRNIGMLKSASQPVLAQSKDEPQQLGMIKSQSSARVNFPQAPAAAVVPPEAINLKIDAAAKQSLADRTGDIRLKQAASAEQSLADKLGSTAATRLNLDSFKRPTIVEPAQPAELSPRAHVPLPPPIHTCSHCGHQEPFNTGKTLRRDASKDSMKEKDTPKTTSGADADRWLRGQKLPSRDELAQRKAKKEEAVTPTPKQSNNLLKPRGNSMSMLKSASQPQLRVTSPSFTPTPAPVAAPVMETVIVQPPEELLKPKRTNNRRNKTSKRSESSDGLVESSAVNSDISMVKQAPEQVQIPSNSGGMASM